MKQSVKNRCVAICVVVLPLLLASGSTVFAQENPGAVSNKEMRELLKRPGRLVSEAKSTRPNGDLQLIGYRVEELELPRNMTVEQIGRASCRGRGESTGVAGSVKKK